MIIYCHYFAIIKMYNKITEIKFKIKIRLDPYHHTKCMKLGLSLMSKNFSTASHLRQFLQKYKNLIMIIHKPQFKKKIKIMSNFHYYSVIRITIVFAIITIYRAQIIIAKTRAALIIFYIGKTLMLCLQSPIKIKQQIITIILIKIMVNKII